jgi:phospholipase C
MAPGRKLLPPRWFALASLPLLLAIAATIAIVSRSATAPTAQGAPPTGIHKIQHVVIIMQENRSFDSYFGTYPGADGIPRANGQFSVCLPDGNGSCMRPYHDYNLANGEGPHNQADTKADVHQGRMDGFLLQAQKQYTTSSCRTTCSSPTTPGAGRLTCTWFRSGRPAARGRATPRAA